MKRAFTAGGLAVAGTAGGLAVAFMLAGQAASALAQAPAASTQLPSAASLCDAPVPANGRALAAIVSPRMVYAMTEWPRMREQALAMGFDTVRTYVDAHAGQDEWQAAARAAHWPESLIASTNRCTPPGQIAHFPLVQVAAFGRVHAWVVPGAMPSGPWQASLAARLADLPSVAAPPPNAPNQCISANHYMAIDSPEALAELGTYERISPDGRFVLRSYSGAKLTQVNLLELVPGANGKTRLVPHPTNLTNEAFPVQGTWRYLVDVNGEHYRFADVLRDGVRAKPLFKAGMTGFYAAASEITLPSAAGQSAKTIHIRSLSWPNADSATAPGEGPLQVRTVGVHDDGRSARVTADTGSQYLCAGRSPVDGGVFTLPMISVDGTAFSAMPISPKTGQPSMRIYSLATEALASSHPCAQLHDLGSAPSKLVFGFGPQAMSAYTDNAHPHVFMPNIQKSLPLDNERFDVLAVGFPGITADGRIMFAATWRNCGADNCPKQAGYVVSDPYQTLAWRAYWQTRQQPAPKQCILQSEVDEQVRRFSALHALPLPAGGTIAP